jgi:protein SCO1/2
MKIKFLALALALFVISCKDKQNIRKLPYYNFSDFTPIWETPEDASFHKIRAFQLVDQEGKMFSEKDLDGKISIIDFFFTSCPGICPKMADSMTKLQSEFENNDDIQLVSHSVTPDMDSVPTLAAYAKRKNIQYNKWKLLTGNKEEIYNLGRKYYFVEEDLGENKDSSIFLHTENFVLIDKNRIIRGIYNSLDPTSMTALSDDIKVLLQE